MFRKYATPRPGLPPTPPPSDPSVASPSTPAPAPEPAKQDTPEAAHTSDEKALPAAAPAPKEDSASSPPVPPAPGSEAQQPTTPPLPQLPLSDLAFTLEGFTNFLLSTDNSAFADQHGKIWQDMTRPLPEYYISSSHNTYLVGHQLVGVSTIEGYIRALLHSCRSVESKTSLFFLPVILLMYVQLTSTMESPSQSSTTARRSLPRFPSATSAKQSQSTPSSHRPTQ